MWKRSQLGAWDCVAGRKCGFKANFAWRDTCRSCLRTKPSVGASQAAACGSKPGRVVDSLSKCDATVWEVAKGALTASQQSEIDEKRRVVDEQPTARSARKQLKQEVAAPPSTRALTRGSTRQSWTPAFCWRKRVTKSRNRKRECSRRLWRQRWRRPGKTARTMQVVGGGGDVATLLSLLAAAVRKGQQQCLLAARHSQLGPEILPGHTRPNALVLLGAAGFRNTTCASIATCGTA